MKRILFAVLLAALFTGCATLADRVKVPAEWCVKFDLVWKEPPQTQVVCVCTDDLLAGLRQAIPALLGTPDDIIVMGSVPQGKCEEPATSMPGEKVIDADTKRLLTE